MEESTSSAAPPGPAKFQKKRPGKQSKARRNDAFRERIGALKLAAYHAMLRKRLLGDETGEIEQSLSSVNLTYQPKAVPLTVATRGVGLVIHPRVL